MRDNDLGNKVFWYLSHTFIILILAQILIYLSLFLIILKFMFQLIFLKTYYNMNIIHFSGLSIKHVYSQLFLII